MRRGRKKLEWKLPLYVGDEIGYPDLLRKKMDAGLIDRKRYLITLSENPGNQLELFSASFMKQEAFWNLCPPIIGVAGSKADAVQVVQRIAEECLQETGNCNIREYLKNR